MPPRHILTIQGKFDSGRCRHRVTEEGFYLPFLTEISSQIRFYCLNPTNSEAPSLLSQPESSNQFSCRDDTPDCSEWDSRLFFPTDRIAEQIGSCCLTTHIAQVGRWTCGLVPDTDNANSMSPFTNATPYLRSPPGTFRNVQHLAPAAFLVVSVSLFMYAPSKMLTSSKRGYTNASFLHLNVVRGRSRPTVELYTCCRANVAKSHWQRRVCQQPPGYFTAATPSPFVPVNLLL